MSEYTIKLRRGENYISMPVIPSPSDPDSVFGIDTEVWEYSSGGWVHPSTLACMKGYLVRSPEEREITISGTDCIVTFDDLLAIYTSLKHGEWALVGPGTEPISVEGTGLEWHIQGYDYDQGKFIYTNVLEVGKAYWLSTKYPGEIRCDNNPYGSLALETGCELMLYYDKNNDGVIDRDELDICYKDWIGGKITEPEFDYVGEAYYQKSINKLCPGCYKGKKRLTFIAKDEHGTAVNGVEIYVDGQLKGTA